MGKRISRFSLGLCYEFTLPSGQKKKLKLVGDMPPQWVDASGQRGELEVMLGGGYTTCVEVPC